MKGHEISAEDKRIFSRSFTCHQIPECQVKTIKFRVDVQLRVGGSLSLRRLHKVEGNTSARLLLGPGP